MSGKNCPVTDSDVVDCMFRDKVYALHSDEAITQQHFEEAANIKNIMSKYVIHGTLPLNGAQAMYGDFSDGSDFQMAMERVVAAQEEFDRLPSRVRDFCMNSPAVFLDNTQDKAKLERMLELGLVEGFVPSEAKPTPPTGADGGSHSSST